MLPCFLTKLGLKLSTMGWQQGNLFLQNSGASRAHNCWTKKGAMTHLLSPYSDNFFIDFELKDRERRKDALKHGVVANREVPTPAMYKEHQVRSGIIQEDAIGGLYVPTFIKKYLYPRLEVDVTSYLSQPKEWHGAPIAALRRALPILGSPRMKTISARDRQCLEQLRDLYFLDEIKPMTGSNTKGLEKTGSREKDRKHRNEDNKSSPRKEHKKEVRDDNYRTGKNTRQTRRSTKEANSDTSVKERPADWVLGPSLSAEDAVHQYAPLFAHR
ncbi:hypothetical protein VTN02DRAFT_6389 [Thermoascus thermophilus]